MDNVTKSERKIIIPTGERAIQGLNAARGVVVMRYGSKNATDKADCTYAEAQSREAGLRL